VRKAKTPASIETSESGLVPSFPIVGIGASAGGMDALTELFAHLPPDTGMAFVVVQYLDPTFGSRLVEALSLITKMTVEAVRDGTLVKPNHVYVIASAYCFISNRDNQLSLSTLEQDKNRYVIIDEFFFSLAQTHKNRAIGVILSGSETDGVEGLRAIVDVGGITFAQEPGSAKFMFKPFSAIDLGVVNMVMPPQGIAEELTRISMNSSR